MRELPFTRKVNIQSSQLKIVSNYVELENKTRPTRALKGFYRPDWYRAMRLSHSIRATFRLLVVVRPTLCLILTVNY